jgi:large subunit ribosomal protein L17
MAMLKNLTRSLFEHGRIKTTYFKAKELEFFVGKYISLAKRGGQMAPLCVKRRLFAFFGEDLTKKILMEMFPRFSNRNGGYTRVTKLGPRRGDAAEMAMVEFSF